MARMGDTRNTYRILAGKPFGKIESGRWMELSQDIIKWMDLL
jgi:hypothetical protein